MYKIEVDGVHCYRCNKIANDDRGGIFYDKKNNNPHCFTCYDEIMEKHRKLVNRNKGLQ